MSESNERGLGIVGRVKQLKSPYRRWVRSWVSDVVAEGDCDLGVTYFHSGSDWSSWWSNFNQRENKDLKMFCV